MASSDSKQGGFKVTDRRSFTDTGSERVTEAPAEVEAPADGKSAAARAERVEVSPEIGAESRTRETGLPEVDFHTFILSLGSSALLHLGELEHPDGGEAEVDLPLAKHTIDILSMLDEKTRGNLTAAEGKLMESLLYDLRLRYVNKKK
jgi:hypothetical protein